MFIRLRFKDVNQILDRAFSSPRISIYIPNVSMVVNRLASRPWSIDGYDSIYLLYTHRQCWGYWYLFNLEASPILMEAIMFISLLCRSVMVVGGVCLTIWYGHDHVMAFIDEIMNITIGNLLGFILMMMCTLYLADKLQEWLINIRIQWMDRKIDKIDKKLEDMD